MPEAGLIRNHTTFLQIKLEIHNFLLHNDTQELSWVILWDTLTAFFHLLHWLKETANDIRDMVAQLSIKFVDYYASPTEEEYCCLTAVQYDNFLASTVSRLSPRVHSAGLFEDMRKAR